MVEPLLGRHRAGRTGVRRMGKARNVILLHTDQQRADSMGCMGNRFARTPNLDRLAAGGSLFTRHIASNPICMPSRASLLTGLYPPGHNVWCNGVPLNRAGYTDVDDRSRSALQGPFHPEPVTMADMFSAAGYDTAAFGKLHLTPYIGPDSYGHHESNNLWRRDAFADWHGPYYGFRYVDLVIGHGEQPCREGHYSLWLRREHPEVYRLVSEQKPAGRLKDIQDLYPARTPLELHNSTWLGNRLCEYIRLERPKDRPFFAFVGFPDPHHPFAPCYDVVKDFENADVHEPLDPEGAGIGGPFAELSQQRIDPSSRDQLLAAIRYTYAMVYQIDRAVGRILDTLDSEGLAQDTIVVFTADHGDYLGDHGYLRKGIAPSDSLVRVPFIVRAPGSDLPARVDRPVSNCDVMPTLAALCGVSSPEWTHGVDFQRLPPDHLAYGFSSNGTPRSVSYTVYDATHRFTWYPHADYVELFDHAVDPGESRNLAARGGAEKLVGELGDLASRKMAEVYNPILARVGAW